MKCPFCGGATERGYIQSSRQIIWSGEKKEGFFLAGDGDIKITEGTLKPGVAESFFSGVHYAAYSSISHGRLTTA